LTQPLRLQTPGGVLLKLWTRRSCSSQLALNRVQRAQHGRLQSPAWCLSPRGGLRRYANFRFRTSWRVTAPQRSGGDVGGTQALGGVVQRGRTKTRFSGGWQTCASERVVKELLSRGGSDAVAQRGDDLSQGARPRIGVVRPVQCARCFSATQADSIAILLSQDIHLDTKCNDNVLSGAGSHAKRSFHFSRLEPSPSDRSPPATPHLVDKSQLTLLQHWGKRQGYFALFISFRLQASAAQASITH
jgi:hypothetical protein